MKTLHVLGFILGIVVLALMLMDAFWLMYSPMHCILTNVSVLAIALVFKPLFKKKY